MIDSITQGNGIKNYCQILQMKNDSRQIHLTCVFGYNFCKLTQMKQDVLKYETDINRRESETASPFKKSDPNSFRYGIWRLQETIDRYVTKGQNTTIWIGNDPNANILAFFYSALTGCLNEDHRSDDVFLKLKYSLYQQSKQTLSLSEQKTFVQHLCLLQYSKDIGEFLKKSSKLQFVMLKIFRTKHRQMSRKNLNAFKGANAHNKIEQLQWFCSFFPFIHYQVITQKCGKVIINNQTFFIVEENQCFFVIQNNMKKCNEIPSYLFSPKKKEKNVGTMKKIKSYENIENKEYFQDQVREFERTRGMSISENKVQLSMNSKISYKKTDFGRPRNFEENVENGEQALDLSKDIHQVQCGFNIMDCIREIQLTIDKQIQDNSTKLRGTKSFKQFQTSSKDIVQSLRSSLNKNKERSDATRPLRRYEEILHQNNPSSTPQSQLEDSESETVIKENYSKNWKKQKRPQISNQRLDFIHQSLGSKQSASGPQILKIQSPSFPKKVMPRFLIDKKVLKTDQNSPNYTPTKKLGYNLDYEVNTPKNGSYLSKKQQNYYSIPLLQPFGTHGRKGKPSPLISQMASGVNSPIASPRAEQPMTPIKILRDYDTKGHQKYKKNND